MKINVFRPPSIEMPTLVDCVNIYNPNDQIFFSADTDKDFRWFETETSRLEKEAKYHKDRYDNLYKGLTYWKSKALAANEQEPSSEG